MGVSHKHHPNPNHHTFTKHGAPWARDRLARRVKNAAGDIWANKPIQAAELMGAPTCSRQETPAWVFPISTIPIPTTILSPSTVPPRSARRLARRVKSAVGDIWTNKPIQAAELMGAPTCSRQETPAWAFPISTIPIPTTILSPSTVPPRSARRLARRVKSAAGGIWANKPIQAAELMGAPTCSRQEAPAWAFPISTIPIPTTILSPSTVPLGARGASPAVKKVP